MFICYSLAVLNDFAVELCVSGIGDVFFLHRGICNLFALLQFPSCIANVDGEYPSLLPLLRFDGEK
ncbi:MAG: hypothetical protein M2R45_04769 [Verrucomicrobia subdivision 3 bacterium]|nr:hypothetical protein [Limisphaerales bacterium]MCS1415098.1 hypothetical protein [Limisphaerales bacterium]